MLTLLARISRANLDVFFSWHPTMLSGLLMAYHWAGCATAALTWASWVVSRRHGRFASGSGRRQQLPGPAGWSVAVMGGLPQAVDGASSSLGQLGGQSPSLRFAQAVDGASSSLG